MNKFYWSKKQDPKSWDTPDCHSIWLPYAEFWLKLFIKIKCFFGSHEYLTEALGKKLICFCKFCDKTLYYRDLTKDEREKINEATGDEN